MRCPWLAIPAAVVIAACATAPTRDTAPKRYPMEERAARECARYEIVTPDVTPPRVISRARLEPPQDTKGSRPGGLPGRAAFDPGRAAWACLQYTITAEGRVESIQVVATSDPGFGLWVARTLGTEIYEPAQKDGKPVAFRRMLPMANEGVSAMNDSHFSH